MTAADTDSADLVAILHTSLECAVRVQMSGGYTERVRESARHVAVALGADRAECTVTFSSIGLTVHKGAESHTAIRHTPVVGVNFSELTEMSRLTRSVGTMTLAEVQERLHRIETHHRRYPAWLVVVMLGLSCASLSILFGADVRGAVVAGLAGAVGAGVRELLTRKRFKPFVFTVAAAFVSTAIVLLFREADGPSNPALAASVLYLVPGVPLLNGTADLLTANYLNGVVRLTMGSVILFAAALGVTVALSLGQLL